MTTHSPSLPRSPLARDIGVVLMGPAIILAVPAIAMQFSDEVKWSPFDFVAAGLALGGSGSMLVILRRRSANASYRIGIGMSIFTALLLAWVNGAVGIIGSEDNPMNLLYFLVLLGCLIGAIVSRFEASGLVRTLFVTAIAVACVPVIAFIIMRPPLDIGLFRVFILNAAFAMLFAGAGACFLRATRESRRDGPCRSNGCMAAGGDVQSPPRHEE